jgi:hypothetical protein
VVVYCRRGPPPSDINAPPSTALNFTFTPKLDEGSGGTSVTKARPPCRGRQHHLLADERGSLENLTTLRRTHHGMPVPGNGVMSGETKIGSMGTPTKQDEGYSAMVLRSNAGVRSGLNVRTVTARNLDDAYRSGSGAALIRGTQDIEARRHGRGWCRTSPRGSIQLTTSLT